MTDPYSRIQKNLRRGDLYRWAVCLDCASLVGLRDGATARIASDNRVSQDAVLRWARAGRTYKAIKRQFRVLWVRMPYSYFDAVGKLIEDEGIPFTVSDAYEYLMDAAINDLTVEEFRRTLPDAGKGKTYTEKVRWYAKRIRRDLIDAPTLDFPAEHVAGIRAAAENLEEILLRAVSQTEIISVSE